MKGALTNILNLKIVNDSVWNQSTLPVKDGGLGIRSAYLSSYTASRDIAFSILPENIRNSQNPFFTLGCEKWMQKAMWRIKCLKSRKKAIYDLSRY